MSAPDRSERGPRPGEGATESDIGLVIDSTVLLTDHEKQRIDSALDGRFAVVPLSIIVDDVEHTDGRLAPSELCAAMTAGARVSTSMPTTTAFSEVYEDLRARGCDHILVLTLSAALSGTYDSAMTAAKDAEVAVTVVDSRTTSAAAGGAAVLIADGAAEGRGAAALRAAAEDYLREETFVVFCPATLEHLERGGRIGRAASLLGRALSIVPVLGLKDGVVDSTARVRTVRKAHARMVAESVAVAKTLSDCEITILVSEGSLDDAEGAADTVYAELEDAARTAGWGLSEGVLSPVLTAHVGPGAVGIVVRGRN